MKKSQVSFNTFIMGYKKNNKIKNNIKLINNPHVSQTNVSKFHTFLFYLNSQSSNYQSKISSVKGWIQRCKLYAFCTGDTTWWRLLDKVNSQSGRKKKKKAWNAALKKKSLICETAKGESIYGNELYNRRGKETSVRMLKADKSSSWWRRRLVELINQFSESLMTGSEEKKSVSTSVENLDRLAA